MQSFNSQLDFQHQGRVLAGAYGVKSLDYEAAKQLIIYPWRYRACRGLRCIQGCRNRKFSLQKLFLWGPLLVVNRYNLYNGGACSI